MNALSRYPAVDPNVLQKLQEARERLAAHKTEAEKLVHTLDTQIRQIDNVIRSSHALKNVSTPLSDLFAPVEEIHRVRHPSPAELGDHAKAVLLEAGRPLKRGAIVRALEGRGVFVPGGDKAKVLGTTLWRLKHSNGSAAFINTEGGYWPSDVPLPNV